MFLIVQNNCQKRDYKEKKCYREYKAVYFFIKKPQTKMPQHLYTASKFENRISYFTCKYILIAGVIQVCIIKLFFVLLKIIY